MRLTTDFGKERWGVLRWLLLAVLAFAFPLSAASQQPEALAVEIADRIEDLGPFLVAGLGFTVRLHHKHITGPPAPDPEWQTTVAAIEIRDAAGTIHYRQSFPYEVSGNEFSEVLSVSAASLQGIEGNGLLVTYGWLPSTPLGGLSWQVFGLFDDRLVPFSKPISAEGTLLNESRDGVVKTATEAGLPGELLQFRIWTGNFFVIYPVRVDFEMAKASPARRCVKITARGNLPRCQYRVETDRQAQEDEMTFVRLHVEAEEGFGTPAHVVLKRDSQVAFLAAEGEIRWEEDENGVALVPGDDFWLKVAIDGKEGWIHTQEDFQAIGLPQAG